MHPVRRGRLVVEDEISKKYNDLLYRIYLEEENKDSYIQPSSDHRNCIGHELTKAGDYEAAILYWNEIREFKEQMLPIKIIDIIHSPKSPFIQIYNETKLLKKSLSKYILSIVASCQKCASYSSNYGDYYVKLANEDEDDQTFLEYRREATECYKNAKKYYEWELNILMKKEDDEWSDENKLNRLIVNRLIQDTLEKIANHRVKQGDTLANDTNKEEDNQHAIEYYEDAKFNYNYALNISMRTEGGRDEIIKFYHNKTEQINKTLNV
ncbi:unnamed protein product [Didymodactylos carnosus]|uniref:Uncharacterized protein n=1 Tax=Didymodactylos carnosus TaxID=1234261 RepID=A0A814IML4_9BILA|nr:unnamed protein product [Didymodactylos carnosus]CAF3796676.1 unnamed protein product [Didymodactylos carnosus]